MVIGSPFPSSMFSVSANRMPAPCAAARTTGRPVADWFGGVWAWTDEEVGSRARRTASPIRSSSSFGAMRREAVRTRGEEGRDLPDGENRLEVSRRGVRRRDASSGSGARRRDVVMTYPRPAGAKSWGG